MPLNIGLVKLPDGESNLIVSFPAQANLNTRELLRLLKANEPALWAEVNLELILPPSARMNGEQPPRDAERGL